MSDVRTPELVINKLTKQQYESIQNPSDTELYLVPEDEEHKPICYPTTASEVGTTSMLVKSSISDNGKILTENGFVYNTSGNPTVSDTKVICDLGVGLMEKKLENLTMNTEYHIKSYGQNSSGLVYGSELVQRTLLSPIPVEYQLVEYLESNGTQYINTGHRINSNIFEFHVKFVKHGTNVGFPIGNMGNDNNKRLEFYSNGAVFNILLDTNIITNYDGNIIDATLVCSTNNQLLLYYNDDVYSTNFNSAVLSNANSIWIGKRNANATQVTSSGRIYFYLYKESGVYLRNMYPVYRISDSKPGMYDIVNNVFYTNQGSGEFIVGPNKEWDE